MSILTRVVQGFAGLGITATIPLVATNNSKDIEFRLPPPEINTQVMKKLVEEGACTISKGHRGGGSLYLCLFLTTKGDLAPQFLLLTRLSWSQPRKYNKINRISLTLMQFSDGTTKSKELKNYMPPLWMKQGWDINPEKDCRRKEGTLNEIVCKNSSQQELKIY